MRQEKRYLAQEVSGHLNKSDYVYLVNYKGITVSETAHLRKDLDKLDAEFHVVKNSAFTHAAREKGMPSFDKAVYQGQIAIVVGGEDPSAVASTISKFIKAKDKCPFKAGLLGQDRVMLPEEIEALAKLPSKDVLRAQLLGLFNKPAEQLVRQVIAGPQSLLNVLKARQEKVNEGE